MRLGILTGMVSTEKKALATSMPGTRSDVVISENWQTSMEKIKIAEDLGYECVVVPESWQLSAIPWLSLIAEHTNKIQIGTSIINSFSRSPAALAQDYATLEIISEGRMILGIGSSSAAVVENYHGIPFKKPLRRLKEYTEIFNILISGEKLFYEGEIYNLTQGFSLRYDRPRDHVPVWIASLTPKSLEQSGEIADGIMPVHWPSTRMNELRQQLDIGAKKINRDVNEVTIAPHSHLFILDGNNDNEIWDEARRPLEMYINRMGNFYHEMMARTGWEKEVRASQDAFAKKDKDKAVQAISNEMVEEIQVIGTIEQIREKLQQRSDNGADLQIIYMPKGDPKIAGRLLEKLIS
ncbi:MAG: LLM class flavin-dependent oxidoreductase [Dehalococcoidia bacterium]